MVTMKRCSLIRGVHYERFHCSIHMHIHSDVIIEILITVAKLRQVSNL